MRLWAEHPGGVPVLKSVPAATARPPTLTPSRRGAPRPTDETNSVVRALALYRTRLAQRDGGSLAVLTLTLALTLTLTLALTLT